jgi:hypothetical protein
MQAELELQIAAVIREVDGNNTLGASALAEHIATTLLAGKVLCEKEPVYMFRRRGQKDWCSCNADRYAELGAKNTYFEVQILYAPASPLGNASLAGNADIGKQAQQPDYKALYHELVYQVATVIPNETRHQTALRYIREREDRCNAQEVGESSDIGKEGGE